MKTLSDLFRGRPTVDQGSDRTMDRMVVEQQRTNDGGWLLVEASIDPDHASITIELDELSAAPPTATRTRVDDGPQGKQARHANLRIEVTVTAPAASVANALDHDIGRPLDALVARFRNDGRTAIAWALDLPGATVQTRTRRVDR